MNGAKIGGLCTIQEGGLSASFKHGGMLYGRSVPVILVAVLLMAAISQLMSHSEKAQMQVKMIEAKYHRAPNRSAVFCLLPKNTHLKLPP